MSTTSSARGRYYVGALLVFLSAFCFALKGILIKLAYSYGIDAISLLALRMSFAFPLYVLILLRINQREAGPPMTLRQWAAVAGLGMMGYYVASYFNFLGLEYITASLERILLFTYPTFVLLINALVLRRRVTRLQLAAVALTYAGILVTFLPTLRSSSQPNLVLGAFWVIMSGLAYAIYLVGSERVLARMGAQRFTCYAMLIATFPTIFHGLAYNGLALSGYPWAVYALGALMAVVVTVIPTFMMAEGIRRVGSSNASIVGSVGPIFTILLATSVLGEPFRWAQALGTILVLAGVILIGWRGRQN